MHNFPIAPIRHSYNHKTRDARLQKSFCLHNIIIIPSVYFPINGNLDICV